MSTDRTRLTLGLIVLAWIACVVQLPITFVGLMGASLSPTAFHGRAADVALFALAPFLALAALAGVFVSGVPSAPRLAAMSLAAILSLVELGILIWIWRTF
jgi:hypothetical protein